jgi:hypothetical protein
MVEKALPGIVFLVCQSLSKVYHMNQGKINTESYTSQIIKINLPVAKLFNKANQVKACKYRNEKGFCARSQQLCPATLFTITFNN